MNRYLIRRVALSLLVLSTSIAVTIPREFSSVASAATMTLPDLKINVPVAQISIGTNSSSGHRQLQFTHQTWDAGTGPFAILPTVNPTTGISSFSQEIYRSTTPGTWVIDHQVPLAVAGNFQAPSDYNFPLTRFTLNSYSSNGLGPVVAVSPKVDYCITGDTYIGGVANTPNSTSPPQSDCTNPNALLGFSVGWGDQYDQTDNGQPIDLTGVPDGVYVLHATVDPQHIFVESNSSNDVTDTKIHITGSTVQVLGQSAPTTPIPSVSLTTPTNGSKLSGTVTLRATAHALSPATVTSVRYLLDGKYLGPSLSTAPFSLKWGTLLLSGRHTLSAQVTDSQGTMATSSIHSVTIVRSSGVLSVDSSTRASGHGTVSTPKFSTQVQHDTLIALVSCDGPLSGSQSEVVSGAGLSWHLIKRSNSQAGDAEIWTATAPHLLYNVHVTASEHFNGFAQQLHVLALAGSSGIGAYNASSAPNGASHVALHTSAAGSLVIGVGSDWDQAVARTVVSGQSIVSQWVDTSDGDTFWVQGVTATSTTRGQLVTLADSAPSSDRWDMAAVEIKAATRAHFMATITTPAPHEVLSSSVPVHVVASDDAPLRSVSFILGGKTLATRSGSSINTTFMWNTQLASNGAHQLSVHVRDATGRLTIATVPVIVANPAPQMTCFVLDVNVSLSGNSILTTRLIHVASPGERLVAIVRTSSAHTSGIVSSPGTTWRLIRTLRDAQGTLQLWSAVSTRSHKSFRLNSRVSARWQQLTVIGVEGTSTVSALAVSQTPHRGVSVSAHESNALIFAVGLQAPGQSAISPGWSTINLVRHSGSRSLFWVGYATQPTNVMNQVVNLPTQLSASSPTSVIAVELPGTGE